MQTSPFSRPSPWTYSDRCEDCGGEIGAVHEDRCACDEGDPYEGLANLIAPLPRVTTVPVKPDPAIWGTAA